VVIRTGYLDGHLTKASWTASGVRDKVGATHLPLPGLVHARRIPIGGSANATLFAAV
jgi:hypothetical protein